MNTTAQILVEVFDFGTPAQKSKATREMNRILAAGGVRIQNWSMEERNAGLYEILFTDNELHKTVEATGYMNGF